MSNQGSRSTPGQQSKAKKTPNRDTNLAEKYQATGQCTTVMIRNIPSEYMQDELIEEFSDALGSHQLFDFFYLPWDTQNNCNVGYAFVNFLSPSSAQIAVRAFSNYRFQRYDSSKMSRVSPAHIQGLENNLRHLKDRAVVLGNKHFSPVVMWKGDKVELSHIFKMLHTQDALRKFENRSSLQSDISEASSPGGSYAGSEGADPRSPTSDPGQARSFGIKENFAKLLDRAVSEAAASRKQAMINRGRHSSPAAGSEPGMWCPPGPPPGQFMPRSTGAMNTGTPMPSSPHDLVAYGVTIDPDMYMSSPGMLQGSPVAFQGGGQFPCDNPNRFNELNAAGIAVQSSPSSASSQASHAMLSAPQGYGSLNNPKWPSTPAPSAPPAPNTGMPFKEPLLQAPGLSEPSGFKEIKMKDADLDVYEKFMQKFGP